MLFGWLQTHYPYTHLQMVFYMAMKEPDTRIDGFPSHDDVTIRRYNHCILYYGIFTTDSWQISY